MTVRCVNPDCERGEVFHTSCVEASVTRGIFLGGIGLASVIIKGDISDL